MNKRGQETSGGSAATVIGIIALLFIFYILFIPPEDRAKLLADNTGYEGGPSYSYTYNHTLLLSNIGKLDYIGEDSYDHTLPNVYLTESRNAQQLSSFSPYVMRHGWFENRKKELTFTIAAPDKTDNVLLVFQAPVHEGILTVTLNDQVIYEAPITSQTPPPIPLRNSQLSSQNKLALEISGVGLAFWHVNEFQMSDVQIIGDITDESYQQSTAVFTLLPEEARNVQQATFYFFPICTPAQIGTMEAYIDNARIFAAKPDCESINKIELDTSMLHAGANNLQLRSTKGTMRVEQLRIHTQLSKTKSYVDYFMLNSSDIDNLHYERARVWLRINFVDDNQEKVGTISINGRLSTFDQRNATFTKDITDYVQEGNNYLELRPESILNIVKLDVRLE